MKAFLKKLSYTVLPLWLICVGLTAYYHLMVKPYINGDIGKLGMIPFASFYQRPVDTTMVDTFYVQIDALEQLPLMYSDVLVCGDSFTSGKGQGLMAYHNYLARMGVNVVSCSSKGLPFQNPFKTAVRLMERGYIDSLNTGVLIIETVERSLYDRLAFYDYFVVEADGCNWYLPFDDQTSTDPSWSLLQARNYVSLMLGIETPVHHVKLNRAFFTGDRPHDLYFYKDDLLLMSIDDEQMKLAKKGLEKVMKTAREKGVQLLLLVCPDKYDIYQKHIIDNPYPPKTINEDFRWLASDSLPVLFAKDVLQPHVDAGEMDIYYQDDSHWSYKSAKYVAEELARMIEELQQKNK